MQNLAPLESEKAYTPYVSRAKDLKLVFGWDDGIENRGFRIFPVPSHYYRTQGG
ncbi:MAG: hypothetical protein ACYTDW_19400 [Planctomycetota bacterium]|jgi:hypothetical protein